MRAVALLTKLSQWSNKNQKPQQLHTNSGEIMENSTQNQPLEAQHGQTNTQEMVKVTIQRETYLYMAKVLTQLLMEKH